MKLQLSLSVLILAGVELTFFPEAVTTLCFEFVLNTELIIWRCFYYCWEGVTQSQSIFCFSCCHASGEAGGAQEGGRRHRMHRWPQLATGMFKTVWHHALCIKVGKRRDKGTFGWCLPKSPLFVMGLCSPGNGMAEHLPAHGKTSPSADGFNLLIKRPAWLSLM